MLSKFSLSEKKSVIMGGVLISVFLSMDTAASVTIIQDPWLPVSRGIGWTFVACISDFSSACDQAWAKENLPAINTEETATFTASDSTVGFYLGNSLNGEFQATLTPSLQLETTPPTDELEIWFANRQAVLTKSKSGLAVFSIESGTDYYLILNGIVRGNQTYSLQVSQVPLPPAIVLFGWGMILVGFSAWKQRVSNP